MMKTSISRIVAGTIILLSLTACMDVDPYFDYRKKGEPARLESITGVWDNSPRTTDSSSSITYVVIRNDSTYLRAWYVGDSLTNGQVDCYYIWETTITELGEGSFLIGEGEDQFDIFTYKDKMGYYTTDTTYSDDAIFEYKRSTNTETELSFEPVCEG